MSAFYDLKDHAYLLSNVRKYENPDFPMPPRRI